MRAHRTWILDEQWHCTTGTGLQRPEHNCRSDFPSEQNVAPHDTLLTTWLFAEGDYVLLSLQTARYLMKSLDAARKGEPLAGPTAGLAALSDNSFSPLKNGRASLGLPVSAESTQEILTAAFLEKLFQWRSLVCITRVGAALDKARAQGLSETDAWNANARLLYTTACTIAHLSASVVSDSMAH